MQPTQNTPENRADQPSDAAVAYAPTECEHCGASLWVLAGSNLNPVCRDCIDSFEASMDAGIDRAIRQRTADEVAQTLRDTRLYLQRHGWNQGEYYDATAGLFTPPACLVGAVGIVCYGGPVDAPAQMFDDPGFGSFEQAVGFLDLYLFHRFGLNVYGYNDVKGRTCDDVLAMLEQAATAVRTGMFPMCCNRFMSSDDDSITVGCLGESEPYVGLWHDCRTCGSALEVECHDPDVRERLVTRYRRQAETACHDGMSHQPGASDRCTGCDMYCYCTAEFTCVAHDGGVPVLEGAR
ncbi:DUF6197 family protein [Dactylosporangium sp. McL0621]|uniref:DUF6197 family protein n=1 Tax=Dactylosporangium sp. McL0621 TaxID=3415678 RepID=UPI003CF0DA38